MIFTQRVVNIIKAGFHRSWLNYNFMHFDRQNAFQNALNYIFPEKEIKKKNCVPTLPKFSDPKYTYIFI